MQAADKRTFKAQAAATYIRVTERLRDVDEVTLGQRLAHAIRGSNKHRERSATVRLVDSES